MSRPLRIQHPGAVYHLHRELELSFNSVQMAKEKNLRDRIERIMASIH